LAPSALTIIWPDFARSTEKTASKKTAILSNVFTGKLKVKQQRKYLKILLETHRFTAKVLQNVLQKQDGHRTRTQSANRARPLSFNFNWIKMLQEI
jgi:hypothetical protein